MGRISPFSPLNGLSGSGTGRNHRLRLAPTGGVTEVLGDSQLPYQLGDLSQWLLDTFPESAQLRWDATDKMWVVGGRREAAVHQANEVHDHGGAR